jgi:ParB family chromosome partitioning protein
VEPELDADGAATGFYFVTIGEGRRLAQLLRLKRKEIKKTEPILCVIDTANDPHEIRLDENVTRENMHPADQFEAFKKLAQERGFGVEEIAARFGVTPHVVRQRDVTDLWAFVVELDHDSRMVCALHRTHGQCGETAVGA